MAANRPDIPTIYSIHRAPVVGKATPRRCPPPPQSHKQTHQEYQPAHPDQLPTQVSPASAQHPSSSDQHSTGPRPMDQQWVTGPAGPRLSTSLWTGWTVSFVLNARPAAAVISRQLFVNDRERGSITLLRAAGALVAFRASQCPAGHRQTALSAGPTAQSDCAHPTTQWTQRNRWTMLPRVHTSAER